MEPLYIPRAESRPFAWLGVVLMIWFLAVVAAAVGGGLFALAEVLK